MIELFRSFKLDPLTASASPAAESAPAAAGSTGASKESTPAPAAEAAVAGADAEGEGRPVERLVEARTDQVCDHFVAANPYFD